MDPNICPACHQPILPQYYFCPNCGAKIKQEPLSTTIRTQAWIYFLSIILPPFCFIFIKWWPATKYLKSPDPKAKLIGQIAWALLVICTIITIWLVYIWTMQLVQSSLNSINTDFGL